MVDNDYITRSFPIIPVRFYDNPEKEGWVLTRRRPLVREPYATVHGELHHDFHVRIEDIPKMIRALQEVYNEFRKVDDE